MKIHDVITDISILEQGYVLRDGYEFKSLTNPGNVYDALVIKNPPNACCWCPRIKITGQSLTEQIDFVNQHKLEKSIIVADDISFMTKCPTLYYINVIPSDDANENFDFSPLYDMPEIKSLVCQTEFGLNKKILSSIDYSKVNGLVSVGISGKGHLNYNKIETLKSFSISFNNNIDLNDMFNSKILDTLYILQCKLKSLEGIQFSEKMQCLYLDYNRSLSDITSLRYVKNTLKALRIENCSKITDFSVLSELENLQFLELSGTNELPNLNFLKTMKNLKTFAFSMNVLDGDLTLCKNLEMAYIIKQRKHYNLRNEDLPKKPPSEMVRGNENIEEWRKLE